jgi:hypothetical protein
MMSFDSKHLEPSKLPSNTTDRYLNLRTLHEILLQRYQNLSSASDLRLPLDVKCQFNVYYEVFKQFLPESFRQHLLRNFTIPASFKKVNLSKNSECLPSLVQSEVALNLENHLLELTVAKKGGKKTIRPKEYIIENKFYGLSTDILPVDIVIKEKRIKIDKIRLFIEVISVHLQSSQEGESTMIRVSEAEKVVESQQHQEITVKGGEHLTVNEESKKKRFLKREDLLKQRLYQKYYPKVPYITVLVNSSSPVLHHLIIDEVGKVLNRKK